MNVRCDCRNENCPHWNEIKSVRWKTVLSLNVNSTESILSKDGQKL